MKFDLKYILKIAAILTLAIFVTERLLFNGGFNLPLNELFTIISIHFMYAFVLTAINGYFFYFLDSKFDWKMNTKKLLILGASGSVMITMIGLVVLRFVTLVVILGKPIESFINDVHAASYYTFGLVITLIVSLVFHTIYFYKALTEKKVKEQQIVAKTETAKYESLKSQIDPHFLFNSLNVLTSLISENPKLAEKFTTKLSKVYRYFLEQKNKDLIELDEELSFAKTYM
jgi:sensor histidine kinase YesM